MGQCPSLPQIPDLATEGFVMRAAVCLVLALLALPSAPARADALLQEAVDFTGAIFFLSQDVPGMVVGAIRDGETAVAGFGTTGWAEGEGREPDGETLLRIGSITKVFTGALLASLAADGTVGLSDPLQRHLSWDVTLPSREGREIRLVDLATHSSGLPREVEAPFGPPDDPYRHHTRQAFIDTLESDPLLFAPGSGALYSNLGYHLLATALADAAGQSFEALLADRVLAPASLESTGFAPEEARRGNLMQGHNPDGSPLPDIASAPATYGSGALYSSANDILKWLAWHLDDSPGPDAEMRLLDHAAWRPRDGLNPVYGLDESGHMDAMGLGWVVMAPEGDRPLILQKAGGMQGVLSYVAFAPGRGVGAFVAINRFDFNAATAMAEMVNELIAQLAPR